MKFLTTASAFILSASAALAAPLTPDFFFTAFDQGNNGYGVNATAAYPIAQESDFTINFTVAAYLLRGSEVPGTADRKSYGFLLFDLPGVTSVSNASLTFQNALNFTLNTSGFPAATPTIGIKSNVESSFATANIGALASSSGLASTSFETMSPAGSSYTLDMTALINAALTERAGTGQQVVLIFENLETFADLPSDVNNGGYGNTNFSGFSLNAVEGPAPIPLPAGLPLLLAGVAAFGIARKAKS